MRLFLLSYKQYGESGDLEDWQGLVFAENPGEAQLVAQKESGERFGIRKAGAQDFKIIKELKKPALFAWAKWIPCELDEEEFQEVR